MKRAFKYRIYPTDGQAAVINSQLELCRTLYNAALEQRIGAYRAGVSVNYSMQQNELPAVKEDNAEYSSVHSQVLQDVLHRLDRAFANFFRRVKERKAGSKVSAGFPRFKSADRYSSLTYPQSGFSIHNNRVRLSGIGNVKIRLHRQVEGTVKTCTVKRDSAGDWWAVFTSGMADRQPVEIRTATGVDVGLIHPAVTSGGDAIEPPKSLKNSMVKLKTEQRALSSKQKGSSSSSALTRLKVQVREWNSLTRVAHHRNAHSAERL